MIAKHMWVYRGEKMRGWKNKNKNKKIVDSSIQETQPPQNHLHRPKEKLQQLLQHP